MKQLYSNLNRSGQSGIFIPLFLLILFSILAVLGLAVDLTSFYRGQIRLQRAVDAAALAAARLQLQSIPAGVTAADVSANIRNAALEVLNQNIIQSGFSLTQLVGSPEVNVTMQALQPPTPGTPVTRSYTAVRASIRPSLLILDMLPFIQDNTILTASAEAEARSAIISLVLDVSGSMAKYMKDSSGTSIQKIAALKEAATGFVQQLRTGRDVVSLSTFSTKANTIVQPNGFWDSTAQLQDHRDRLVNQINGLSPDAWTNASEALFTGFSSIKDKIESLPLPCYIVFFTDGAPNHSVANWVPSNVGSPSAKFRTATTYLNPASAPLPTDWFAYTNSGIAENFWYRSRVTSGGQIRTSDIYLEPFCPNTATCAGRGSENLVSALRLNQPIQFRAPGPFSADDHTGRLYSLFNFTDPSNDSIKMRKLHYLTAIAMADYVRGAVPANKCTIFSIGLGEKEEEFDDFYQTITDDGLPRKDYFLSRVANDATCGRADGVTTCRDEPDGYVDTYEELRSKGSPRGTYYPTDSPAELAAKFQDVLANIRLRLNR